MGNKTRVEKNVCIDRGRKKEGAYRKSRMSEEKTTPCSWNGVGNL